MPWTNKHLEWLEDTGEKIETVCGHLAPVYRFNHNIFDNEIMLSWATHTLAFFLSSEEERKLLVSAFELISKRVFTPI